MAFDRRVLAETTGDAGSASARMATISMGAFILHVHLLARDPSLGCDLSGGVNPRNWDAVQARRSLAASLPLIMAGLGSGPPPMTSASGRSAPGGITRLADPALLWLMWCLEGLNRAGQEPQILPDEMILPLVQVRKAVPARACISPLASY